jgi:hypothetical protein
MKMKINNLFIFIIIDNKASFLTSDGEKTVASSTLHPTTSAAAHSCSGQTAETSFSSTASTASKPCVYSNYFEFY